MGELPDYLATSMQQALHLNLAVRKDKFGCFIWKQEGVARNRVIGTSFRQQLNLALSCGRHFKYVRISSVNSADDLLCPFCTDADVLKEKRKIVPGPNEKRLASILDAAGLLSEFRFQPKVVVGWTGGVDFYSPGCKLVVQVDDPSHFKTHHIYDSSRGEILGNDMALNKMCWEQGLSLLRLAQDDVKKPDLSRALVQGVLDHLQQHGPSSSTKVIVLSSVYSGVQTGELDCTGPGMGMYVDVLEALVHVKPVVKSHVHNSVWFTLTM